MTLSRALRSQAEVSGMAARHVLTMEVHCATESDFYKTLILPIATIDILSILLLSSVSLIDPSCYNTIFVSFLFLRYFRFVQLHFDQYLSPTFICDHDRNSIRTLSRNMIKRVCSFRGFPSYMICDRIMALMLTLTITMIISISVAASEDVVNRDEENCLSWTSSERSYRCREAEHGFVFTRYDPIYTSEFGGSGTVILEEKHLMQLKRFAVGVLIMKPQTLLLPHYLSGPSILYVHRGEVTISQISLDGSFTNKTVTVGDGEVHMISAGTLYFLLNRHVNETFQATILVDLSDVPKDASLMSFYLAGATFPTSILSGFTDDLLAAAFKVDSEVMRDFLYGQWQGPIIDASDATFEKLAVFMWIRRASLVEQYMNKKNDKRPCLLEREHDSENENGWRSTLDLKKCENFRNMDLGMFAVSLRPGCMVAPHWNPDMTVIAVVTYGKGRVQIVSSDGSTAVDEDVEPGDIFVVPRYYPSSQIAGDGMDFKFIGFTTSSEPIRPYYLAGANSVFNSVDVTILSKTFDVDKSLVRDVIGAQSDQVFLTSQSC